MTRLGASQFAGAPAVTEVLAPAAPPTTDPVAKFIETTLAEHPVVVFMKGVPE